MKVEQFLIFLLVAIFAVAQPLWAEDAGQAPLQLAPGSGVQQEALQHPPSARPGHDAISGRRAAAA